MTLLRLPWWLDYENPPADNSTAQAVWILGQWHFIPFVWGTPLRRMCGTLREADQVAAAFESDVQKAQAEADRIEASGHGEEARLQRDAIAKFIASCEMVDWSGNDEALPTGFRIYAVGDGVDGDPYIISANGRLLKDSLTNYEEAVNRAREIAERPSQAP
jgi:hypothetical protein